MGLTFSSQYLCLDPFIEALFAVVIVGYTKNLELKKEHGHTDDRMCFAWFSSIEPAHVLVCACVEFPIKLQINGNNGS